MNIDKAKPVWEVFWHYVRKHPRGLGFMFTVVTLASVAAVSESYILKLILDRVAESDSSEVGSLFLLIGLLFVVNQLENGFFRASGFTGLRVMPQIRTEVRWDLFRHLRGHSQRFFNNYFSGSLAQKINQAGRATDGSLGDIFWNVYVAICVGVFGLILLVTVSPIIALIEVPILGLFLFVATKFIKKGLPKHKEYADARSRTTGQLTDTVGNMNSVITYVGQRREQERIYSVCLSENEKNRASWRYQEWVRVFNDFAISFIVVFMMGVGIVFWSRGIASVGDIAMIFTLTQSLAQQTKNVSQRMLDISENVGDIKDAIGIIGVDHDVVDKSGATVLERVRGDIAYENVSFLYPEGDGRLFRNLDVRIPAGERVALVGASGSGKTTFARMLLRMYDVESGCIRVDGHDIRSVTQASLRENIAVVNQETDLFHRTLYENIAYGKPSATLEEVKDAARRAYIHEFISSLPAGYETYVGERGVKLSGGQKQRVAIARAILKDAPILLLDEATSSLDSESEYHIQKALEPLTKGRTVIAAAHRLSTIQSFDRILVFQEGEIVEDGSHIELVNRGGVYAGLWNRQSGGFLLSN